MHDHADMTSCDDQPDRLGQWLRLLAADAATALSWRWVLRLLPGVFLFLANLRARLLLGRTAIVRPSRTGGADHSARAVMRQRNPMVFGGDPHAAASCNAPRRSKGKQVHVVVDEFSGGSWITTRRVIASMFLMHWPASCAAHEVTQ